MKKISALLCVLLVAVTMSACSVFHHDSTQNFPQEEPYTATVLLQVKGLPADKTIAEILPEWRKEVLAQTKIDGEPQITEVKFSNVTDGAYQVNLTITNMPDKVLTKTVRPWKITYTQTIYNPIALLPSSEVFTYIVGGYAFERRHSDSNATEVQQIAATAENPKRYVYYWSNADTIQFVDNYPNRPLYIVVILAVAALISVVVYAVSRYSDCKKRKHQL